MALIGSAYWMMYRDTEEMTKTVKNHSAQLISAIAHYKSENGVHPVELEVLIPKYIDKIPDTGLHGFNKYKIITGDRAKNIYGVDWVLVVPVPSGFLNWDDIAYINDNWRYIHE